MESFTRNNLHFYEMSGDDWLADLAKTKGLDTAMDLVAIKEQLKPGARLLEIGCGRGRVANWIHRSKLDVQYSGIDFSVRSIGSCRKLSLPENQFQFSVADARTFKLENHFDVVLWPWSGLLELSDSDKAKAVGQIADHLAPEGRFFIDLPKLITGQEKLVYRIDGVVEQHSDFGYVLNKILSEDKVSDLCEALGFSFNSKIEYFSANKVPRTWLVFSLASATRGEA